MGIFAKAGELVTCENGHEICEVATDLHTQAKITASQFRNWRFPIDTTPGNTVPNCPQCGAKFMGHPEPDKFPEGGKLHVGDEWRPVVNVPWPKEG